MSIQSNFPAIAPTLNLSFALTKALDPRITFSRASTATYYGTQTAKAEENLLLRSQEFDNGSWNKTAATVSANATTAPDGTTTADVFTVTATGASGCSQAITTGAIPHTFSVFAKAGTCSWIQLFSVGGTNAAWFDLTNGVVGTVQGTTNAAIQSVGSGWYRCSVTSSVGGSTAFIRLANADASADATNATTLELWGAQLEQRSAVTAYTATTTQPITNYIPVLQTAASGVARFDHNPTTFESLGLLIEEQRTNLLTYSEQFDNAAWTKTRTSITANTIVAPSGELTGDKLVENTDTNTHFLTRGITLSLGSVTFSCYVKAAERSRLRLSSFESTTPSAPVNAIFDVSAGTVISGTGTITAVGNGWYRCSASGTVVAAVSTQFTISLIDTGTNTSYTGDGYSGIYIWGAQLEAGAFATSYIQTVASQVTRAADASPMTGSNFSRWFSNAEGTLYAELNARALAASNGIVLNDNTTNNRIRMALASTTDQGTVTTSGAAQAVLDGGTPAENTATKVAMAYAVNDFALSLNGGAAVTDTVGTVPVVSQLQIGAETTTTGNLHISKIAFYPKRLSNVQIQALTT